MKEKLDDSRAVAVEVLLQVYDRTIPILPNGLLVEQFIRKALAAENLRMDANDENFLIIGPIKNTDSSSFRQATSGAPEKIVIQFLRARLLKTKNLAALWIYPGHDLADDAVLAGGIHPLKNKQHGISVGRVMKALQHGQLLHLIFKMFVVFLL